MKTVAGASTNSRAFRPLPPGALEGTTLWTSGPHEYTRFRGAAGWEDPRVMLSWVAGQNGCLWGGGRWPDEIVERMSAWRMPGSYGHFSEHELARALGSVYDPLLHRHLSVRFFQDGGAACAAAARVARYITGRNVVASYGYHGAQAEWAHEPNTRGILPADPEHHIRLEWGNVPMLEGAAAHAACIMLEVPAVDDDAARSFLLAARAACDVHSIPLIIDDVVLGFRLALGGSVEYYGIEPDMVCLGKALSAGGGVAALLGTAELVDTLDGRVFYSTTFGGHPMGCAIAAKTVEWLEAHRAEVYGPAGHLRTIGTALKSGLQALGLECAGQPERFITVFPDEQLQKHWSSQMAARGIIAHRPFFPLLTHKMAHVEQTLQAARALVAR